MGLSGAVMFNSAVDQMQSSAKNLEAIREARRKRQMEDEAFDLKKKEANLNLEKLRLGNTQTQTQIERQEAIFKEWEKSQKAINAGKDEQIKQAEHKEATTLEQAGNVAEGIYKTDPIVQSMVATRVNPKLATSGNIGQMEPMANPSTGEMSLGVSPQAKALTQEKTDKSAQTKRGKIVSLAQKLAVNANDGMKVGITPEMIKAQMATAEELLFGTGEAPENSGQKTTKSDEKVEVIDKQGKRWTVPAANLEKAIAKGYKRVQ
jgi:hypothetical protein